MGKGNRIKRQRKAHTATLNQSEVITPIDMKDVKNHHSYWVCGFFWDHDMVLVEPFFANKLPVGWEVTNLSKSDIEYYHATRILSGGGTMLIFEDRVMALEACEAIENQNILLESFATYMDDKQLLDYINGKGE